MRQNACLDMALSVDNTDELLPSCPNLLDLSTPRAGADTDCDTLTCADDVDSLD